MTNATAALIAAVPWGELRHASGDASDIPPLLRAMAAAKGRRLYETMDELCSRVLHQGAIYSASPPVARVVIGMLADVDPREKPSFYGLLTGFADSARRAIEGQSGGDPAGGAAIRDAILGASACFVPDLTHSGPELRAQAAGLLTAFADADPAMARLVRQRYAAEADPRVRHAMLAGIERVRACFEDWPAFLAAALEGETALANRYLLHRAQVCHLQAAADSAMVDSLVAAFVQVHATESQVFAGDEPFFLAIHSLGAERERAALLGALKSAGKHGLLACVLAERLLRSVFADRRTGWEEPSAGYQGDAGSRSNLNQAALRLMGRLLAAKLFPSLMSRKLRQNALAQPERAEFIRYLGVTGDAPPIPSKLTAEQSAILTALAREAAVWRFHTNLWDLFGLPNTAAGLAQFTAARS
jgi:hypothetical protein